MNRFALVLTAAAASSSFAHALEPKKSAVPGLIQLNEMLQSRRQNQVDMPSLEQTGGPRPVEGLAGGRTTQSTSNSSSEDRREPAEADTRSPERVSATDAGHETSGAIAAAPAGTPPLDLGYITVVNFGNQAISLAFGTVTGWAVNSVGAQSIERLTCANCSEETLLKFHDGTSFHVYKVNLGASLRIDFQEKPRPAWRLSGVEPGVLRRVDGQPEPAYRP